MADFFSSYLLPTSPPPGASLAPSGLEGEGGELVLTANTKFSNPEDAARLIQSAYRGNMRPRLEGKKRKPRRARPPPTDDGDEWGGGGGPAGLRGADGAA